MPDIRISPRERLVLTAIIELYIATGEPVASQALARSFAHKEGLSSATLRNVMASLGDAGLLEQPHTSSGRVPTAAAFRYYVEQITQAGRAGSRGPIGNFEFQLGGDILCSASSGAANRRLFHRRGQHQ